jgi:hypothetical protein
LHNIYLFGIGSKPDHVETKGDWRCIVAPVITGRRRKHVSISAVHAREAVTPTRSEPAVLNLIQTKLSGGVASVARKNYKLFGDQIMYLFEATAIRNGIV